VMVFYLSSPVLCGDGRIPYPVAVTDVWSSWDGGSASVALSVSLQPVEATDDAFWDQFWADTATSVQDVFALVPAAEIRAVREESPSNLATLCYKVRMALSSSVLCWQEVSLH